MATSPCRELLELSENHTRLYVPRKGWAGKSRRCCLACIRGISFLPEVLDARALGQERRGGTETHLYREGGQVERGGVGEKRTV